MKKLIYSFLVFSALLSACRSFKPVSAKNTRKISSRRLFKELSARHFDAQTFDSRIKIKYKDTRQSVSGSGQIRILKDSIVWVSVDFLGIPLAKMLITPHKIQYYNKIHSEYYDGDFDFINQKLGTNLNFDNLQNLLMGDVVFDDLRAYKLSVNKDYYELKAQSDSPLRKLQIYPFFKLFSEVLESQKAERLEIRYFNYRLIGKEQLPKTIKIRTEHTSNDMEIEMEYKTPRLNQDLGFPFHIPSGYKEIKL